MSKSRIYTDEQRAERRRKLQQISNQKRREAKRIWQKNKRSNTPQAARPERKFIGIDGESCDACTACQTPMPRSGACPHCDGVERRHRYRLLAAANAAGESWVIRSPSFLSTEQCLTFIDRLPEDYTLIGFSLGFDWTKILQQLPNATLRELLDSPQTDGRSPRVEWGHWRFSWLGSALTLTNIMTGNRRTVWDVFKYFQTSFVKALSQWKVCEPAIVERINAMKQERSAFHAADWSPGGDVERYCIEECQLLAQMMTTVQAAANEAGLKLWPLHGAGSLAGAMLRLHKVQAHIEQVPEALDIPVRTAYYGGRFEVSRIGPVEGPLYAYDINSAYPYACLSHPSLHGEWIRGPKTKRELMAADEANRYLVVQVEWSTRNINDAWGPFPVRLDNGSVIYPGNGKGWYWLSEVMAAIRLFGQRSISYRDSWELVPADPSARPFAFLADYYRKRKQWGKNGPGIVMKLGMNAVYGKLAQSVGYDPPFRSLVWAGMTTAKTRAMLMDAMANAQQLNDVVSLATDSVVSSSPLHFEGSELLGDWDRKVYEDGLFIVRPGIYFALSERERDAHWEESTRGRGISRRVLHEYAQRVLDAWEANAEIVPMPTERFVGLRSGLRRTDNVMGEWEEYTFNLAFDPRPKRLWSADRTRPRVITEGYWSSMPYRAGLDSEETQAMKELKKILIDQPTGQLPLQDVLKVAL